MWDCLYYYKYWEAYDSVSLKPRGCSQCPFIQMAQQYINKTTHFPQSSSFLSVTSPQSKLTAGETNRGHQLLRVADWSFPSSEAALLTNTFWHYWCSPGEGGSVTCINFKRQKQNCELSPSVLSPGLFDPDPMAVRASQWLPAPTLDMRGPCSCSTRLCGWQESTADFIGQAAGTRGPQVNWSPIWCLLVEIRREGRACGSLKQKCKSTSANKCCDGSCYSTPQTFTAPGSVFVHLSDSNCAVAM